MPFLVVEERVLELRVLDDRLRLVLAERLGVLLPAPGLDLPAALAVVRGDAGEPAEGELLADLVGALARRRRCPRIRRRRRTCRAPHREHGAEALGAADPLRSGQI